MRLAAGAAALGVLVGCTGFGSQVRERAAFDFKCPGDRVSVDTKGFGYVARGCRKEAVYIISEGRVIRNSEVRDTGATPAAPGKDSSGMI